MTKNELLNELRKFTVSVDFADEDIDNTLQNTLSARRVSPITVNIKYDENELKLFGGYFQKAQLAIEFHSIKKVDICAYSRIVVTKGAPIQSSLYFINFNIELNSGFNLNFESRDYDHIKSLLNLFEENNVNIQDFDTNLTALLKKKNTNEIDEYLAENWSKLAKERDLIICRSGYSL